MIWQQAHCQGGASGCNAPTNNSQNIKVKHIDQPAKKMCDTLPHLHGASRTSVVRDSSFPKTYVYSIRFVGCYSWHYTIKELILWSSQRCYLQLDIHNIHTQYMCNRELNSYINIYMYVHLHCKALHYLCTWPGYGPVWAGTYSIIWHSNIHIIITLPLVDVKLWVCQQ